MDDDQRRRRNTLPQVTAVQRLTLAAAFFLFFFHNTHLIPVINSTTIKYGLWTEAYVPHTQVIALRGAGHVCPPDSAFSYSLAIDSGSDAIYSRLQLTSDDVLVVYGADRLNVEGKVVPIRSLTLTELQSIDLGGELTSLVPVAGHALSGKGNVLTLSQAVELLSSTGTYLYIEVPSHLLAGTPSPHQSLSTLLQSSLGPTGSVLVVLIVPPSHLSLLQAVREAAVKKDMLRSALSSSSLKAAASAYFSLGVSVSNGTGSPADSWKLGDVVVLDDELLSSVFVSWGVRNSKALIVRGVDEIDRMKELVSVPVSGIVSGHSHVVSFVVESASRQTPQHEALAKEREERSGKE